MQVGLLNQCDGSMNNTLLLILLIILLLGTNQCCDGRDGCNCGCGSNALLVLLIFFLFFMQNDSAFGTTTKAKA